MPHAAWRHSGDVHGDFAIDALAPEQIALRRMRV
jgi:hypothetical protein